MLSKASMAAFALVSTLGPAWYANPANGQAVTDGLISC